LPFSVKQDRGVIYIDENKARCPKFPLEPLFRSVYLLNPDFNPKAVDVVTDRKNLRALLSIICGKSVQDFRMDIELVEKTLLFTRWVKNARGFITDSRGYGHEFEKSMGTYSNQLKRSTSHHRVIQYSLMGISILLRFEADCYMLSEGISTVSSSKSRESAQICSYNGGIQSDVDNHPHKSKFKLIRAGHNVPHSSIVELKTCNERKWLLTSKVVDQLWFGQVRHLKIGYHNEGLFSRIEEKDFKENGEFQHFENRKSREVRNLIRVIEKIRAMMMEHKTVQTVLLYEDESLHLYKRQHGTHALPRDLLSKWE